jgi:UDPglucose--hexose-1-phosphate uridylyltransferase
VRVVRNKYPVVSGAEGIHEVGIDAPEHDADLPDLSAAQLAGMLRVYRDRVAALEATAGIAAVLLFRNRGRRAGSSQPHPHSQIAALSWTPAEVALRWEVAKRHLAERGEPVHAAELRRELGGERLLRADRALASFCPRAPSRPYEIRFAPRAPNGGFATATDAQLEALADHLRDAARRLRAATSVTDHNLVLRQPPARASGPAAAWHLELLPRTGGDAGFELGAGEMIVVVAPEEAAERLRAAKR